MAEPSSADLPRIPTAGDLDAAWLAAALGTETMPVIRSATSIGTGQVGENVRYVLGWPDDDSAELPTSVVAKFPSTDPTSRATAAATGSYVKEVGFYRHLAATVAVPSPVVHHVADDPQTNSFVLLMEDVAPAEAGDQLHGCPLDRAELAVDAAVGLHAAHWGNDSLPHVDWLPPRTPERASDLSELYGAVFDSFASRYEARLDPGDVTMGRDLGRRLRPWFAGFRTPTTLVHGDYRPDNMLFGLDASVRPLTIVDWQTVACGHGPADVAYFVGAGLERRSLDAEPDLLDRYVDHMQREVPDCEPEAIRHDYALGAASGYVMAVIASQIVVQTERGDEMFCVMAERHAAQMRRLETLDRL